MDYFQKFRQEFSCCLNKTFEYEDLCHITSIVSVDHNFVCDIVFELVRNLELQEQVLKKVEQYVKFADKYEINVLMKPVRFQNILDTFRTVLNKATEYKYYEGRGYIIDFNLDQSRQTSQPVEMNARPIIILNNDISLENVISLSRYDMGTFYLKYEMILCRSVVGKATIDMYGLDGFLALLIIFFPDYVYKQPLSLEDTCKKFFALNISKNISNFHCNRTSIALCLDAFKFALTYELFPKYVFVFTKQDQISFFKRFDDVRNTEILHFENNYEKIYKDHDIISDKMFPIAKQLLDANTTDKWIEVLKILQNHNDSEIEKVRGMCRRIINGIPLKIKKKEFYKLIDGKRYFMNCDEYFNDIHGVTC